MRNHLFPLAVLAAGTLALAGCGGGAAKLTGSLDYSNHAEVRHSYTPYKSSSHAYIVDRPENDETVTEVYIGGDHMPRERLRHVATENNIRYFIGSSRDGVGVERLNAYRKDLETENDSVRFSTSGLRPFARPPKIYLSPNFLEDENLGILAAFADSIQILNDALPPEYQLVVEGTKETSIAYSGEIMVHLGSAENVAANCGAGAAACARYEYFPNNTDKALVVLPDDMDLSEYMLPRKVIIHELLHALGIHGHVDSVEFPDSIMGTHGEHIPNIGFVISKIDREVLQAIYMSQRTDLYNDWGEWSDTAHHLAGQSEGYDLNFGVALFNGLPMPWAKGTFPDTDLADNADLTGTATWTGSLLAFSGPSPLAGDAELEVHLDTLSDADSEQDLRFRDIYFLNRFESESEDRWFHTRDIDYKVNVAGNGFSNVRDDGYEQGVLVGTFMGPEHEHMGGTVKRTDMVGAFGGSRD